MRETVSPRHKWRGYFDTDGCLYLEDKRGKPYPRVELVSISSTFMQQVRSVLLQLGFRLCYYKLDRKSLGWQDSHRIIIRGYEMTSKWFNEIKPKNPKHLRKFEIINGPTEI